MCIAIPMLVEEVEGLGARCSARGCYRNVSLLLVLDDAVRRGDYVLVHQGVALRAIDATEAALIWEAFDLAGAAMPKDQQVNFVNDSLSENASC
jgi:hydrogenase expression/formation protein HypC